MPRMSRLRTPLALILNLTVFATRLGAEIPGLFIGPSTLVTDATGSAFHHQTGRPHPSGWLASYRLDAPGYLVVGAPAGGDILREGVYEFDFSFSPAPGGLAGLFQRAHDAVRVEAWDSTVGEQLVSRTFQRADFLQSPRLATHKSLVFSTEGRQGHRFEPRVYWPGLCGLLFRGVTTRRVGRWSAYELDAKASLLEETMGQRFLKEGFVLAARTNGTFDDYGDTGIWTGLYAAAEAWRWQTTHDPDALQRMEKSLWALHSLQSHAPVQGTLLRYLEPLPGAQFGASKDTYTGFVFALAQALPSVENPALRRVLLRDAEAIGTHFLDNDFTFRPARGAPLGLNPYPSRDEINEGLRELSNDPSRRRQFEMILGALRVYFWVHGERPWREVGGVAAALHRNRMDQLEGLALPFMRDAVRALSHAQRQVRRSEKNSFVYGPAEMQIDAGRGETSFRKLDLVLRRVLDNLSDAPLERMEDAKVLPSQALHALHILKVLGDALPKPNRFGAAYQANLWQEKQLLKTVIAWDNLDEAFLESFLGHTGNAVRRNPSRHLTFLALYDLISFEKDPEIRQCYRAIFDEQFWPMQEDQNAMLHVMRSRLKMSPSQSGVGLWSLMQYSVDRRGRGVRYWKDYGDALALKFGGRVNNQAADPVPLAQRQRDTFIWQRSARSIGGDDGDKYYPPIDFLFVYWLARCAGDGHRVL